MTKPPSRWPFAMCGEPSPNDKNGPCSMSPDDHPQPCWCREVVDHQDEHECRCGEKWPRKDRDLADLVERITITEVQPGDVLLFEMDTSLTDQEFERFKAEVRGALPEGVHVAVLEQARLRGVIRLASEVA